MATYLKNPVALFGRKGAFSIFYGHKVLQSPPLISKKILNNKIKTDIEIFNLDLPTIINLTL